QTTGLKPLRTGTQTRRRVHIAGCARAFRIAVTFRASLPAWPQDRQDRPYCGLMIGWVFVGVWAALRFALFRLPARPTRCVAGLVGVSRSKGASGGGPSLGESPGIRGGWGWWGGLGFGVVGSGVCSLLVRSPEAIRNLPGGQAAEASRCAVFPMAQLDLPAGPSSGFACPTEERAHPQGIGVGCARAGPPWPGWCRTLHHPHETDPVPGLVPPMKNMTWPSEPFVSMSSTPEGDR